MAWQGSARPPATWSRGGSQGLAAGRQSAIGKIIGPGGATIRSLIEGYKVGHVTPGKIRVV